MAGFARGFRPLSREIDVGALSYVTMHVSLGERESPEAARVPDVVGMVHDDSITALRAKGFGTRSSFADADRPFMEVIGQQPAGGTLVEPGTEVEFIASRSQG
jgi:beta-lactam-binding protein with PASTA domain